MSGIYFKWLASLVSPTVPICKSLATQKFFTWSVLSFIRSTDIDPCLMYLTINRCIHTYSVYLTIDPRIHTYSVYLNIDPCIHTHSVYLTIDPRIHTHSVYYLLSAKIGSRGLLTTMLGESAPLGQPASSLEMPERQKAEPECGRTELKTDVCTHGRKVWEMEPYVRNFDPQYGK